MEKKTIKKPNKKYDALFFETMFPQKINYHIKWFIMAIIVFGLSQAVVLIHNQEQFLICRVIYMGSILLWPILYIRIFKGFNKLIRQDIWTTFWDDKKE